MRPTGVRYIVDDVQDATAFYTGQLGFTLELDRSPGFAVVSSGGLRLFLNVPGAGGAGQAGAPTPGGWNRLQLEVDDLDAECSRLEMAGVSLRTAIVTGKGGRQALVEDPAGNPVELFEPA